MLADEDYDRHRDAFRQHFTDRETFQRSGRTWEEAEPNYRYGYGAASGEQYRGREFAAVEPEVRGDYEGRYGQAEDDRWQRLREEIRAGWDRARSRLGRALAMYSAWA